MSTRQRNNKVSVITPSFNNLPFIGKTIESVLNQTYTNFEYIIIDDNSTDGTQRIINEYANRDRRIKKIFLKENKGAAVARNIGIEMAKGRFIVFLDSDDLWKPDKLQKQLEFMLSKEISFSYTRFEKINEDGVLIENLVKSPELITYNKLLKVNYIRTSTVMYDSLLLGKQYFPQIRKRQDFALWLKILKISKYGYGLTSPLAFYRVRKNSLSSSLLSNVKYNWKMYREIEKKSILKSFSLLICNIYYKIFITR